MSRWYAPGEVNETGRMVSLAVATLHAMGVSDPKQHLFMASSGNVATLVVSRSALSAQATESLRQAAATHEFTVLLEPQAGSASASSRASSWRAIRRVSSAPPRHPT